MCIINKISKKVKIFLKKQKLKGNMKEDRLWKFSEGWSMSVDTVTELTFQVSDLSSELDNEMF